MGIVVDCWFGDTGTRWALGYFTDVKAVKAKGKKQLERNGRYIYYKGEGWRTSDDRNGMKGGKKKGKIFYLHDIVIRRCAALPFGHIYRHQLLWCHKPVQP